MKRAFFKESSLNIAHYYFGHLATEAITPMLHKIGVTPNIVTLTRIPLTVIIILLLVNFTRNKILFGILIVFFLGVNFILDDVDGYMARRYNQCSTFGAHLDIVVDIATALAYYTAVFVLVRANLPKPIRVAYPLLILLLYGLSLLQISHDKLEIARSLATNSLSIELLVLCIFVWYSSPLTI